MNWANFALVLVFGFVLAVVAIYVVRWAFGVSPDSRRANIVTLMLLAGLLVFDLLMAPIGT